jgi:hypothetical protein
MMRHPVTNKPILNAAVCTDDFGSLVFVCQYTQSMVTVDSSIFIGPVMPNVNGTYVCAPHALAAFKSSRANFNAEERNCNTCKSLQRIQHAKNKGGFLYGRCGKGITEHQYPMKGDVIMFHPDDPMGMPCWEARP